MISFLCSQRYAKFKIFLRRQSIDGCTPLILTKCASLNSLAHRLAQSLVESFAQSLVESFVQSPLNSRSVLPKHLAKDLV